MSGGKSSSAGGSRSATKSAGKRGAAGSKGSSAGSVQAGVTPMRTASRVEKGKPATTSTKSRRKSKDKAGSNTGGGSSGAGGGGQDGNMKSGSVTGKRKGKDDGALTSAKKKKKKKNEKKKVAKSRWLPEDDELLRSAVRELGSKKWKQIAERFADRTDLQCQHRWQKVLSPTLHKGPWSKEEDAEVIRLVGKYGPKK